MIAPVAVIFAGLFGLAVGSFLNVCIYRVPLGKSLAYPPSACPSCGHQLAWFENVPVLAWLVLRGRCRTCRASISIVYPLVELFTGAMFVWAWMHYGPGWLLVSHLLFGCVLVVLFFVDLEHRILPNVITLPGIVIGFLFAWVNPPGWMASLIGIVAGGLIPYAIAELYVRIRGEEGLGMGDVKMLAMIGAFLGWKLMLLTLVLASFLGTVIGLMLIAIRKGDMKSALPFGTFLTMATFISIAVGSRILDWYLRFF